MDFPPEHYFETSLERIRQAWYLYSEGRSYALSIYTAGVAVECLLRAFKSRRNQTFDERHDLLKLFVASGLLNIDRALLSRRGMSDAQIDRHLKTIDAAIHDIFRIWANRYRYASEDRLRSHLKRLTGYQRIRGDYLKEQNRRVLDAAQILIDLGTFQWRL